MSDPESPSDHELLLRLRDGDDSAIEDLYPRHANDLHAFAARFLGQENAEDALQMTFERVLRRIETYKDSGGGRSWLWQIHRNVVYDVLRKRAREPLRAGPLDTGGDRIPPPAMTATGPDDPDDAKYRCLEVAFSRLAADDRREIDQGPGRGTGRNTWHAAVGRLRIAMTECLDVSAA